MPNYSRAFLYNQRMEPYFARDYTGGAFVLFGAQHLLALAFIAGACLLIVRLRDRFSPRARVITRWSLAALIYLSEGSWHLWMLSIGAWSVQGMLPLWLCSLTSWTLPLLLIGKQRWYFEWVYCMGIIGAGMALLQPDLMIYGFPHFRFIEYFTLHGLIIISIVYIVSVEGWRPTLKALPGVLLATNLWWGLCALVNSRLDSNYMYTQGKLPTPSLLDVLGPHPWYLLWMEVIGIVLCVVLVMVGRRKIFSRT